jgi:hypothetical protein
MRDRLKAIGIPRVAIAADVTQLHLSAFVDAFLVESSRVRVRNLMRRNGWRAATSGYVESRLDPRSCTWDIQQSRPAAWDPRFRSDGIYIGDSTVGLAMTLEQASAASLAECSDAIFSIVPGVLAVFLNHEWGVCYCSSATKS